MAEVTAPLTREARVPSRTLREAWPPDVEMEVDIDLALRPALLVGLAEPPLVIREGPRPSIA